MTKNINETLKTYDQNKYSTGITNAKLSSMNSVFVHVNIITFS